MSNIVIINGKTYTERIVDNIVVDGKTINGNAIPAEYSKPGEMVNLDINVKSIEDGGAFSISSTAVKEDAKTLDVNLKSSAIESVTVKETWNNRLLRMIINFLSKFIK